MAQRYRVSFKVTELELAEMKTYVREKRRWRDPAGLARDAVYQLMGRYPVRARKAQDKPEKSERAVIRFRGESSTGVPRKDSGHISPGGNGRSFREKVEQNAYWYLLRKKIFERDEYRCQKCGGEGNGKLHIHHIRKRREGGTDSEDNLITLCPSCHSKAEPHRKSAA